MPPAFLVGVTRAEETVEVDVPAAVAGGICPTSEYESSTTLLKRLADSGAEIGDLLAWGRAHAAGGGLPREEREALLRKWAGAQGPAAASLVGRFTPLTVW